jgi:hypothetical protein
MGRREMKMGHRGDVSRSDATVLWVARVTGGLMVLVLGFVMVVNIVSPMGETPPRGWEWFGLSMFPLGVFVGYALAFWRNLAGGTTALACLLVWLVYVRFATGVLLIAAVIAVPGILYLVYAARVRRRESRQ